MHRRFPHLAAWLLGVPSAACVAPDPRPLDEPITIRVAAADSTHSVRFALDVTGGEADLRAPRMHGLATDARLIATTPADVILRPGTTAASFRALGGGQLQVSAVAPQTRLRADGPRVRIRSTVAGLWIRDY